jgi:hypothetical protein
VIGVIAQLGDDVADIHDIGLQDLRDEIANRSPSVFPVGTVV